MARREKKNVDSSTHSSGNRFGQQRAGWLHRVAISMIVLFTAPAWAAPTFSSFSPASGPIGTAVTIKGTNFSATKSNDTVKVNGTTATVTSASTTQLVATVPSGATTGKITITVGGQTATSTGNFTITAPAPTITTFTPTSGVVGASVTITGTNFSATAANDTVKFNGTAATVSSASTTQLVVAVPSGATTGTITVTVGGQTATSTGNFSVTAPAPTITGFTPSSGLVGAAVTITGTNFSATAANDTVKFNGSTATVSSASTTQLVVAVPSGATTGTITVTVGGQTATSTGNFTITAPAPTITTFTPTSGVVGASVTITGTNFSATAANDTVKFNGSTATVSSASTTQLVVAVPSGATTGTITVTVGGQTATSTGNFSVTAPAPTITGFTPTSGAVGTSVTITGTNFSATAANDAVKFNGIAATVSSASTTQLVVAVPSGATTGTITVTVGGQTATSSGNFTVTGAVPTITGFTPTSGPIGTSVTITGTNFSATKANDTVKFNGTTASVTSASTTQLVVAVPSGATSGAITVTVASQTATSSSVFTITTPPKITSFSPTSGATGIAVTITGSNFDTTLANNSVTFNGLAATVTAASATQLTVTVPNGASTGKVGVSVGGQSVTSSGTFTVSLSITGFSPTIGASNSTVVIQGKGFSTHTGNNQVYFNGPYSAYVSAATSTQLTVQVPGGSTSGPISVTVNNVSASSAGSFTIAPSVQGAWWDQYHTADYYTENPYGAPAGAVIEIEGDAFDPSPAANTVTFNGIPATVTAANNSQLTVTVPVMATSGPLIVTTNGLPSAGYPFIVLVPLVIDGPSVSLPVSTPGVDMGFLVDVTALHPLGLGVSALSITPQSDLPNLYAQMYGLNPQNSQWSLVENINITNCGSSCAVRLDNGNSMINILGGGLPYSATYTLILRLDDTAATMGGTVTMSTAVAPALDPSGAPTSVDLTRPGALAELSLSAPANKTLTFNWPAFSTNTEASMTLGVYRQSNGYPAVQPVTMTPGSAGSISIPAAATDTVYTIVVQSTDGTVAPVSFSVTPIPPTITSFSPGYGPVGSTVTIVGEDFGATTALNAVTFGGVSAVVNSASETQLVVTVPAGAPTGPIAVTANGGTAISGAFVVTSGGSVISAGGSSIQGSTTVAGQSAVLTFNAGAGQNLGLAISPLTLSSGNAGASITITAPNGSQLTTSQCSMACELDLAGLPATGVYMVTISPNSAATLSFTATLSVDFSGTLDLGSPFDLSLYPPGQIARLAFTATQGETLGVEVRSLSYTGALFDFEVLNPDGTVFQSRSPRSFVVPLIAMPTTGTYTLVMIPAGYGGSIQPAGDWRLTLQTPAPLLVDGPSITQDLRQPGQTGMFTFNASAGQHLGLGMVLPALWDGWAHAMGATVYGPDGTLIAREDYCPSVDTDGGNDGCRIEFSSLPKTGAYTIVTGEYWGATELSPFTYTLSSPSTASITIDGPAVDVALRSGQTASLTFNGIAGQNLELLYPYYGPEVIVQTPSGDELVYTIFSQSGSGLMIPTLPATGTYTITIRYLLTGDSGTLHFTLVTFASCDARIGPIATSGLVTSIAPNQIIVGQNYTVIVAETPISPVCGPAVGTVTVYDDGYGNTCSFDTPAATGCSLPATSPGSLTPYAQFAPADVSMFQSNQSTPGAPSATATITANPVHVAITGLNPTPVAFGAAYTANITVIPAPPLTTSPTGYVYVSGTNTQGCYLTLPAASCELTTYSTGPVSITAYYSGDATYAATTSPPVVQNVVAQAGVPTIDGFSPASGPVGATVTISGSGFDTASVTNDLVTFGSIYATVLSASDTQLVVLVPNGAATAPISVSVNGQSATSNNAFTVISVGPTITGFTPASGIAGAIVTISGTGFDGTSTGNDHVTFNTIPATLLSVSATQLVATVPAGATTGPIAVSVGGQSAISTSNFTIVPIGTGTATVAISSALPEPSIAGQMYTVHVAVTAVTPGTTPTGTVLVGDGFAACLIDLPATSCDLATPKVGEVTLFATYSGDTVFAAAQSSVVRHFVNPSTPTEMCGLDPQTVPNDPPGFVALTQLSGALYSPGIAQDIVGSGTVNVVVISPLPNASISGTSVDVVGTFVGPVNTGITVNGVLATTVNGAFLAQNVPLTAGSNTLTVVAATLPGITSTTSLSVTQGVAPTSPLSFAVDASTGASGLSPMTIKFDSALAALPGNATVQSVAIDIDGDGNDDYTAVSLSSLPSAFIYDNPGVYAVKLKVLDNAGHTYTATRWVLIQDRAEIRNMLCDVYGYLKDRLRNTDATGAANAFQVPAQADYLTLFNALGNAMPGIVAKLGFIGNGTIGHGRAEMTLIRDNANQTRNGFPLRMTIGADGVWRISAM